MRFKLVVVCSGHGLTMLSCIRATVTTFTGQGLLTLPVEGGGWGGEWTLDPDSNHCSFLPQLHVILGSAGVWKLGQGWDINAADFTQAGVPDAPILPFPTPIWSWSPD